jgi:hypothetical protein
MITNWDQVKPGDVMTYRVLGVKAPRRMRVTAVKADRFGGADEYAGVRGVVLTKSGAPHKQLNSDWTHRGERTESVRLSDALEVDTTGRELPADDQAAELEPVDPRNDPANRKPDCEGGMGCRCDVSTPCPASGALFDLVATHAGHVPAGEFAYCDDRACPYYVDPARRAGSARLVQPAPITDPALIGHDPIARDQGAIAGRVFARTQGIAVEPESMRFRMVRARVGSRVLGIDRPDGSTVAVLHESPEGWHVQGFDVTAPTFRDALAVIDARVSV